MGALRRGVTWVFRRIMGVYFRRIEAVGEIPGQDVRGRLFVANHVNGILDPILVFLTSGCDISPVAKSTLWSVPVLRWLLGVVDSVQIVRRVDDPGKQGGSNDHVFDQVAAWLLGGGNILIFPEGTSHSEPHLVEIKTGTARMLLRACQLGSPDTLTVQPIAMEFDAREEARSRVLLIYGPAWRVSDLGETGALAPGASDTFIARVTERIRGDLSERLVEGDTWEDRRLVGLAAEMLANDSGDSSLEVWNAMGRRWQGAMESLASESEELAATRDALISYSARLDTLGIGDSEVVGKPICASIQPLVLLTAPFAAIGILLVAPPRALTNRIADRVKSRDETGTIRLGAALVFYPSWTAVLLTASLVLAPLPWSLVLAALALICLFASLPWVDALPSLRRRLRAYRAGPGLEDAKKARAATMTRIRRAVRGTLDPSRGGRDGRGTRD